MNLSTKKANLKYYYYYFYYYYYYYYYYNYYLTPSFKGTTMRSEMLL